MCYIFPGFFVVDMGLPREAVLHWWTVLTEYFGVLWNLQLNKKVVMFCSLTNFVHVLRWTVQWN